MDNLLIYEKLQATYVLFSQCMLRIPRTKLLSNKVILRKMGTSVRKKVEIIPKFFDFKF